MDQAARLCPGRRLEPELMDDPSCGPDAFRRCLVDLARVNRLTLAYRPTLAFLARATHDRPTDRPWRILDVGGGYGDALRRIDGWAASRGIALDLTSVDLSPWAREAARHAPPTRRPIRFETADIFAYRPAVPPDLVISSLFAHHLEDAELVRFLDWMERHATQGWFVNDLERHALSQAGFRIWSRAAGWHRFVRHDGPVSIGRAFTRADWRVLLDAAGLGAAARIEAWAPFRLCVARHVKPARVDGRSRTPRGLPGLGARPRPLVPSPPDASPA